MPKLPLGRNNTYFQLTIHNERNPNIKLRQTRIKKCNLSHQQNCVVSGQHDDKSKSLQ